MSPMLYLFLGGTPSHAWPADTGWTPLLRSDVPMTDPAGDAPNPNVDLVGDKLNPVAAWDVDATYLYLRMRLNRDPCYAAAAAKTCSPDMADSWGFLISSDADDIDFEAVLVLEEHSDVISLYGNADGGYGWNDSFAGLAWEVSSPFSSDDARSVLADSSIGTDDDYFVDLRVPLDELDALLGGTFYLNLRVSAVTSFGFYPRDESAFRADISGGDNNNTLQLEDLLSDPLQLDADSDDLLLGDEEALGTDPGDADSDDDGVSDGVEHHIYGSDPLACDTDDDGILDGTEVGLEEPTPDTAKKGCFVPDADPSTTTLPDQEDSDGGGLLDGDEDLNQNGALDLWETDPNLAEDDRDADKDGIPDALEALCGGDASDADGDGVADIEEGQRDSDGDDTPNFCDPDDDNDTIPTIEEGDESVNTDDDNQPDYLDKDSDNDGSDDIDEGTDDEDCDDIRNFQDPDDTDGPCGSAPAPSDDTGSSNTYGFTGGNFTGGGCSALPASAALWPALAALLGLSRRQRRRSGPGRASLLVLLLPGAASAQEVNAQLYQPALDSLRFSTVTDTVVGAPGFGGGLSLNYVDDPFVYRYNESSTADVSLLGRAVTTDVLAYGNIGRFRVGVDLPLHMMTDGYALDTAGGHLLGDLGLDAKAEVMSRSTDPLGLSVSLRADLPTGNGQAFLGDAVTGVSGRVGASTGDRVVIAGDVGFHFAASDADQLFGSLTTGSRLLFGIGTSAELRESLWASAELTGQRLLRSSGAPGATPLEGLLSAHVAPIDDQRLVISLGGGAGLTPGVGSPDFRAVASLGWHPAQGVQPALGAQQPPRQTSPRPEAAGTFEYTVNISDFSGVPMAAWMQIPSRDFNIQAGPDGSLRGSLPAGTYEIIVTADGYLRTTRVLRGEDNERMTLEVVLIRPRVSIGTERLEVSERIFFDLNSGNIMASSHSLLNEVAQILSAHPEIKLVEIQGHTDDQGSPEYNTALSKQRAEAVRRYLISRGIAPERLRATGYGEQFPLQEGTTEAARAINRRVEFVLLQVEN